MPGRRGPEALGVVAVRDSRVLLRPPVLAVEPGHAAPDDLRRREVGLLRVRVVARAPGDALERPLLGEVLVRDVDVEVALGCICTRHRPITAVAVAHVVLPGHLGIPLLPVQRQPHLGVLPHGLAVPRQQAEQRTHPLEHHVRGLRDEAAVHLVAHRSEAVPVAVHLPGVGHVQAVVAGIAHPVAIAIELVGVGLVWAVVAVVGEPVLVRVPAVAGVAHAVAVAVGLLGVGRLRAVVHEAAAGLGQEAMTIVPGKLGVGVPPEDVPFGETAARLVVADVVPVRVARRA